MYTFYLCTMEYMERKKKVSLPGVITKLPGNYFLFIYNFEEVVIVHTLDIQKAKSICKTLRDSKGNKIEADQNFWNKLYIDYENGQYET